jgi:hypothetical protein
MWSATRWPRWWSASGKASSIPTARSKPLPPSDAALVELLAWLAGQDYRFVTVNQSTHRTVLDRPEKARGRTLRDVFGWNTPFAAQDFPEAVRLLEQAGALEGRPDGLCKSGVRAASVGDQLFVHSAFPTEQEDSVFLGPDTYRFANLIEAELEPGEQLGSVLDIGAGAGVGGLAAAGLCRVGRLVLTDVNGKALRLAGVNARHAGVQAELVETSGLDGVEGPFDLILANPPFIAGQRGRTYRDGGDMHGAGISLDWVKAGLAALRPGGRLIVYTGSAIVEGEDPFREAVQMAAQAAGCGLRYREIDPDIFGGELKREAYRDVERIAAVGLVATRV